MEGGQRQAGRERETDAAGRPSTYAWATVPPSWLGLINQGSPAGPIFHSQTFTTACSPARDEKGCCHRSYRSCGMSLSHQGISPIWAWSVPSWLGACAGYILCLTPSHHTCHLTLSKIKRLELQISDWRLKISTTACLEDKIRTFHWLVLHKFSDSVQTVRLAMHPRCLLLFIPCMLGLVPLQSGTR